MGLLRIVIGVPLKFALLWFLMPRAPNLLSELPVPVSQFQQMEKLHASIVTSLNRVGRDIRLHRSPSKGGTGRFSGNREKLP